MDRHPAPDPSRWRLNLSGRSRDGHQREDCLQDAQAPAPERYGPRSRRYPKLGPHTATVQRILRENCTLPPSARLSIRNIYECISDEEAFSGSYDSVRRYAAQFFRDAGRVAGVAPKPDPREQLRLYAFEWMRAVLQKEISSEMLRCEVGDVPDLATLLHRLYEGRLSDRN